MLYKRDVYKWYVKTYSYVLVLITVTVLFSEEECKDLLTARKCATQKRKGNCELEDIKLQCAKTCGHCNEIGELDSSFGD